jgi:hypothetical protein
MVSDPARTEPVGSIAEAIARMKALEAALPSDDGVAAFNRMYLQITELVAEQLSASFFADPVFMDRLDVVFANLYFAAVEATVTGLERVPRAWAALLERRSDSRVIPIQFALAGMNAHINRDLSVAVVETCLELGGSPDQGSRQSDYTRINEILASAERSVRQSFEEGLILLADQAFPVVKDVIVNWDLRKARANAWTNPSGWRIVTWQDSIGWWDSRAEVCWCPSC